MLSDAGRAPALAARAPLVRSAAAIAEADEAQQAASIPGTVPTPRQPAHPRGCGPPERGQNPSRTSFSGGERKEPNIVPYQLTLVDLNRRSYYLIHEEKDVGAEPVDPLEKFRQHLRSAVLLANVEVVVVRNCQLSGKSVSKGCVNLKDPVLEAEAPSSRKRPPPRRQLSGKSGPKGCLNLEDSTPSDQVERDKVKDENNAALKPISHLLASVDFTCRASAISGLLQAESKAAGEQLKLNGCRSLLGACDEEGLKTRLKTLAWTLAAYQPAVLDEGSKGGNQSPFDKRTKSIEDVERQVDEARDDATAEGPHLLAELATALLHAVHECRPELELLLASYLMQAACMSGQCELVKALCGELKAMLLDSQERALEEMRIAKRLLTAWLGYRGYASIAPLQPGRKQAHKTDWLDYKCSLARALLTAFYVIDVLVTHNDDHGSGMGQMPVGAAAASEQQQRRPSHNGAAAVAAPSACTPSASMRAAKVSHKAMGLEDSPGRTPSTALSRHESLAGDDSCMKPQEQQQGDHHGEPELTDDKWRLVTVLFERPAACKPLAVAMMYFVEAQRRAIRDKLTADAKLKAAAPQLPARPHSRASGSGVPRHGGGTGGGGMDEAEAAELEEARLEEEKAAEQKAQEAKAANKYRRLHRLAVQAGHLAIHSTSLSAVSDGLTCIKAVQAWPAVNLQMLNDLAEAFPQQCVQLLDAIPLENVELEDNVLPFTLKPGFLAVAISFKDKKGFCKEGVSDSMQDAEHFATQRAEDATIEASLLVLARTWLSMTFLFMPAETKNPTSKLVMRVLGGAVAAFIRQGPGSTAVAAAFAILMLVMALIARAVAFVCRIVYWGILYRVWSGTANRIPVLREIADTIRGEHGGSQAQMGAKVVPTNGQTTGMLANRSWIAASLSSMRRQRSDKGAGGKDARPGRLLGRLWSKVWKLISQRHNRFIDSAMGWGTGSTSISCRKVPMPIMYGCPKKRASDDAKPEAWPASKKQMDTALLEKLLRAPGVHPSVFGTRVLRAFILHKWNYFVKYFIIMQLLLHVTYMAIFLAYAFSIKDMDPVDGRESGPGADQPGCQLAAPTGLQTGLLVALAIMTTDFTVQELRQIRHFGLRFFKHTWDLLDVCSIGLVVASISLHFSCSLDASPITLRGLAAVQIVLLFMRLVYYAMASDKLGSFVRMVLETTADLMLFFVFLSVIFVGFALAIIISQGSLANEEQIFIKLFTMMYGDFDVDFLTTIDSGALGLDALTRVLASIYMILVTIILLNLLISIIGESYERIRENERWESLRNKALLIVESETQLLSSFLTWLYRDHLSPGDPSSEDDGKRFLYVISPEYARRVVAADDDDGDEEEDDDAGGDDDGDAGSEWNGRLGEMKRHITVQGRMTLDAIRKEFHKADKEQSSAPLGDAQHPQQAVPQPQQGSPAVGPRVSASRLGPSAASASPQGPAQGVDAQQAPLDASVVQQVAPEVGIALLQLEVSALRRELLQHLSGRATGGTPPLGQASLQEEQLEEIKQRQVDQAKQEQLSQQERAAELLRPPLDLAKFGDALVEKLTMHVNISVQKVQDQLQQVQLQLDKHAEDIKARQDFGPGQRGPAAVDQPQAPQPKANGQLPMIVGKVPFGQQQPD